MYVSMNAGRLCHQVVTSCLRSVNFSRNGFQYLTQSISLFPDTLGASRSVIIL